jgi:Leucine-rich repeat (LRR) protein
MQRITRSALTAILLLAACQRNGTVEISPSAGSETQPEALSEPEKTRRTETARAIAEFEKLGGTVQIDDQDPGQPVRILDLSFKEVPAVALPQLRAFPQLEELYLIATNITDASLANLHSLANLRTLDLGRTRVTDKGLAHLQGLTNLRTLGLSATRITDAGMAYLKKLTGLQLLDLSTTKVTDAGVKELQRALPKIQILH